MTDGEGGGLFDKSLRTRYGKRVVKKQVQRRVLNVTPDMVSSTTKVGKQKGLRKRRQKSSSFQFSKDLKLNKMVLILEIDAF